LTLDIIDIIHKWTRKERQNKKKMHSSGQERERLAIKVKRYQRGI